MTAKATGPGRAAGFTHFRGRRCLARRGIGAGRTVSGVPRSFRFDLPDVRSDVLVRARLVGALAGRGQHRVTVVAGGAGLGKTTLLVQALAENRLAPRGEVVWVDVDGPAAHGVELAQL